MLSATAQLDVHVTHLRILCTGFCSSRGVEITKDDTKVLCLFRILMEARLTQAEAFRALGRLVFRGDGILALLGGYYDVGGALDASKQGAC